MVANDGFFVLRHVGPADNDQPITEQKEVSCCSPTSRSFALAPRVKPNAKPP